MKTTLTITKKNGIPCEKRELTERIATIADVPMIAEFQQEIRANAIKAQDGAPVFAADDEEFISEIITSKRGVIMLYYDGDKLAAFFEMTVPDDPNHLDEYLVKDYHDVCYEDGAVFESVAVVPEYRGNGLMLQIAQRMHELARERGIKWMTGTVHPENPYSLNNFIRAGYEVLAEVDFHYGRRDIVYCTLS